MFSKVPVSRFHQRACLKRDHSAGVPLRAGLKNLYSVPCPEGHSPLRTHRTRQRDWRSSQRHCTAIGQLAEQRRPAVDITCSDEPVAANSYLGLLPAARAVDNQVRQLLDLSVRHVSRLTREQKGRFVAACWTAHMHWS